jgi:serine/threonine protein kinase
MSPEQTRGIEIDTRTDVWSLGVVLYEMLAGQTPFREETASDTSAAILRAEPAPLSEYLPDIPFELERIVRKALQKDRDERYQGVKDFELDLKSLKRDLDLGSTYERSASGIRGLRSSEMARSTGASKIANTQMASFTRERLAQTPWFWIIVGAIAAGSIATGYTSGNEKLRVRILAQQMSRRFNSSAGRMILEKLVPLMDVFLPMVSSLFSHQLKTARAPFG